MKTLQPLYFWTLIAGLLFTLLWMWDMLPLR